jgi:hypothetical protein
VRGADRTRRRLDLSFLCVSSCTDHNVMSREGVQTGGDESNAFLTMLTKWISSDFLERRLRDIHSNRKDGAACHVFGHTHFCWDSVVDEIRYVQAPLAYPRERKRRMNSEGWLPFCVYRDGFNPEIYPALWSDYYNKNKREPENTQLAPWVARHFAKYHKFH